MTPCESFLISKNGSSILKQVVLITKRSKEVGRCFKAIIWGGTAIHKGGGDFKGKAGESGVPTM